MVSADGWFVITYNGEGPQLPEISAGTRIARPDPSRLFRHRGPAGSRVHLGPRRHLAPAGSGCVRVRASPGPSGAHPHDRSRLAGRQAAVLVRRQRAGDLRLRAEGPAGTPVLDAGYFDRGALSAFMRHNYVPAPFTIYSGACGRSSRDGTPCSKATARSPSGGIGIFARSSGLAARPDSSGPTRREAISRS